MTLKRQEVERTKKLGAKYQKVNLKIQHQVKAVILDNETIIKLLAKPRNHEIIAKAKLHENELKQFYSNTHPELIFARVQPLLIDVKYDTFLKVYKNYAQPIINKIRTHYGKIFSAYGSSFEFDFNGNVEKAMEFDDLRRTIYNGISDREYWRNIGHTKALIEPQSVFVTATNAEGGIEIKHFPLKYLHDFEETESGLQYLILKFSPKDEDQGKNNVEYYYVYDSVNFYVYIKTNNGFQVFTDPEGNELVGPHGAKRCPCDFASNENMTTKIGLKKSRISDSVSDLYDYIFLKILYLIYKQYSAFGTQIKAQVRCEYKNEEKNVICDGHGTLGPIDRAKEFSFPGFTDQCPRCNSNKNTGTGGEVIEIPLEMQGNEQFINNIGNLYQRIDADSGILTFHSEDIDALEQKIYDDALGTGFGEGMRRQAVNDDQVMASMDDMSSNLADYSKSVEQVWEYSLDRAGEMFSTEDFVKSHIRLGRQYFLKSTEVLYQELELLLKSTSNHTLIDKKQNEIIMTEARTDDRLLRRNKRLKAVMPFSNYSPQYILSNREALNKDLLDLYDNSSQVLSIFELVYGPLEDFAIEMVNEDGIIDEGAAIKEIQKTFNEILVDYGLKSNEPNGSEP